MTKGKNGVAAAKRRLAEAEAEVDRLRHALASEKAGRAEDAQEHADEVRRIKRDHAAEVASKADEYVNAKFEERVSAEVDRRHSAQEKGVRVDAARKVGRWLDAEGVKVTHDGWNRLAEALNLGQDAAAIFDGQPLNRHGRRAGITRMNLAVEAKRQRAAG